MICVWISLQPIYKWRKDVMIILILLATSRNGPQKIWVMRRMQKNVSTVDIETACCLHQRRYEFAKMIVSGNESQKSSSLWGFLLFWQNEWVLSVKWGRRFDIQLYNEKLISSENSIRGYLYRSPLPINLDTINGGSVQKPRGACVGLFICSISCSNLTGTLVIKLYSFYILW